jgi:DNA-binding SARP family transcriptional activator/Flp pilus assembly protein TadD
LDKAHLKLLGTPRLTAGGTVHPLPDKAFVLLCLLAGSEDNRASRTKIRPVLWGEFGQEQANANLRQLIARIRKVERNLGYDLLIPSGDALQINPQSCAVDYTELLNAANNGETSSGASNLCEFLLGIWSGPLLDGLQFGEGPIDEWIDESRERAKEQFFAAARRALSAKFDRSASDAYWRLALKMIEIDSTEEPAYRAMMRVCMLRGERSLALRIYGRCKRILATELGVAPQAETTNLVHSLRPNNDTLASAKFVRPSSSGVEAEEPVGSSEETGAPRRTPVLIVLPPIGVFADELTRGLALGFIEDITIGLSRFRSFSVIAPHTGLAIATEGRNLEDALAIIDSDYAVTTSLMPSTHGFRISVRLTSATSAQVLWATDAEFTLGALRNIFDRVVSLVVRSLIDSVEKNELQSPVPSSDVSVYHQYLQGRRLLSRHDLKGIRRARSLFKDAIARVPDYSAAMIGLSRTLTSEWLVRGIVEPDLLNDAIRLAEKAAALDPFDGRTMRERGYAELYLRQHDESLASFEEALQLNPHDADILADYADALAHAGNPSDGLKYCLKAIDLNPLPPDDYVWTLGSIYYQLGRYDDAIQALKQVENNPSTARLLAACCAQLGDDSAAQRYSRVVRAVYPGFCVHHVESIVPNRNAEDTRHLVEGLQRAGLT